MKPHNPSNRKPLSEGNEQTDAILRALQLPHIWTRPFRCFDTQCGFVYAPQSFAPPGTVREREFVGGKRTVSALRDPGELDIDDELHADHSALKQPVHSLSDPNEIDLDNLSDDPKEESSRVASSEVAKDPNEIDI